MTVTKNSTHTHTHIHTHTHTHTHWNGKNNEAVVRMRWNGSPEPQVPHPLSLHLQDWRWALAQGQEMLLPFSYLRPPGGGPQARSHTNLPRGWKSIRKGQTGPLSHPGSVHQSSCPSKREEKAAFLLKRSSKPEREQEGYNVPQKPFRGGYIREYDICSQMNRRHALWIKENVCLRPQWFRWAQHPDFHRYGRKKPLFVDDCVKSTDTFLSPDISQAESGGVSTDARLWSNWHFSLVETFSDWIVFL